MPRLYFTPHLGEFVDNRPRSVEGGTVAQALEQAFDEEPRLRGYILDDQGRLRKHMTIFVDGAAIRDREALSDPVREDSEVYVFQALSGGAPVDGGTGPQDPPGSSEPGECR